MNDILTCFDDYYAASFVKHKPDILIKRFHKVCEIMNISQKNKVKISKSIQYPLVNGVFVILLDCCSCSDFVKYMNTTYIPSYAKPIINSFYNKVNQNDANINIHTYKLKSFGNKTLKSHLNSKPILTKMHL